MRRLGVAATMIVLAVGTAQAAWAQAEPNALRPDRWREMGTLAEILRLIRPVPSQDFGPFTYDAARPDTLTLTSRSTEDALTGFAEAMTTLPYVTTLVIDSPQPILADQLMAIADMIRIRRLDTVIPRGSSCPGIGCAMIFLAGIERRLEGLLFLTYPRQGDPVRDNILIAELIRFAGTADIAGLIPVPGAPAYQLDDEDIEALAIGRSRAEGMVLFQAGEAQVPEFRWPFVEGDGRVLAVDERAFITRAWDGEETRHDGVVDWSLVHDPDRQVVMNISMPSLQAAFSVAWRERIATDPAYVGYAVELFDVEGLPDPIHFEVGFLRLPGGEQTAPLCLLSASGLGTNLTIACLRGGTEDALSTFAVPAGILVRVVFSDQRAILAVFQNQMFLVFLVRGVEEIARPGS